MTHTILIVDDTPANVTLLSTMLAKNNYQVRQAVNGTMALQAAQKLLPDLILLDINMPDLNGYEVCKQLKANKTTADIPVIFISAMDAALDKVQAFDAGGIDYITKPFQIEEVLVRVQTHLTIAQQRSEILTLNEMKDQLMRTVAHDLKNPLTVVMGNSEILLREPVNTDPVRVVDLAQKILRSSRRKHNLITDFLDLSQLEEGIPFERQPVTLTELLQATIEDFSHIATSKDIKLHVSADINSVMIDVDPNRMRQVLANLISNAIKYTPEGGEVDISIKYTEEEMVINIKDNGLGIPPEDISRLFQKFHRVQEKAHLEQEGTGLGLSIAQTIVERHGGKIEVRSQLGQGSIFSIKLPRQNTA